MSLGKKMIGIAASGMLACLLALPAPVMAQGGSINFGFFFGDQRSDFSPRRASCFTNSEIRQAIANRGYTNIALNVPNDGRIEVRATWEGWVYLLDFDYCRDRIIGARQLRPAG